MTRFQRSLLFAGLSFALVAACADGVIGQPKACFLAGLIEGWWIFGGRNQA